MAIICPIQFRILNDEEFRKLDYQIMAHVFASHNELGRLCDERIYQKDIASRLETAGFGLVQTEVPLTVRWRTFRKDYFLDLVVQDLMLYELKTASTIVGEHKTQLLNYILLLGLHSGKLLNLRPPAVESWFASSSLTLDERRQIEVDTTQWGKLSPACDLLRSGIVELAGELGAFLDVTLYEDLLMQMLGGEKQVIQPVEMHRDGISLGHQKCHLISPDIGFRITAHTEDQDQAESQMRRWLSHTKLRALQWINFNRTRVEFTTLIRAMR